MDVPDYPSAAISWAHPARMAAQGMLRGLGAFRTTFKYLELACGDGSNLFPLAVRFPEAEFVGVDIDAHVVGKARARLSRLGLHNVQLECADLAEAPVSGEFDYVVAHGVYSWVAPASQSALLERAARWLGPQGIAYVSYNTLPGWGVRRSVRDVMRAAAQGADTPRGRLRAAKLAIARLHQHLATDNPYGALLSAELEMVVSKHDGYLLGEHLAEHNEALYVTEFLERARAAGLRYLAEQIPATPDGALELALPAELAAAGVGPEEALRYLDVLCYRQFRASLLCRQECAVQPPSLARLRDAGYLSGQLEVMAEEPLLGPGQPLKLRAATGAVIEAERPLQKAALLALARGYPIGFRMAELMTLAVAELRARGLLEAAPVTPELVEQTSLDLLELVERRQLELLPWNPRFARGLDDAPCLPLLSRMEAELGHVTSPRHEPLELAGLRAQVLQLLDGRRGLSAVVEELFALERAGELAISGAERAAFEDREQLSALVLNVVREAVGMGLFPEVTT